MCDFQFSGPVRAPGCGELLIHLLISTLYTLFAWLPHLLSFSSFIFPGSVSRPKVVRGDQTWALMFFQCILSYNISVFLMHGYFAL